ncbi:Palmitoyltransferase zdhhc3 [Perkinsus olseni]|uniref:Palmitoyltransferase n=1 Tax=Perkinsus olseni TaxID=32597 RepID=A0A7J6NAG1_PEROL|nr:Palmitoyltransferase zdhhc3 [Perkinsus olseni]
MTMNAYFDDGLKEGNNNTVDEAAERTQEGVGGQQHVCGVLCLILVWCSILLFQGIAVFYYYIMPSSSYSYYDTTLCIRLLSGTMALLSHIRASLADPGYVDMSMTPPPSADNNICIKCDGAWKPYRAHHCRECRRCVYRMDHHCVWINNCVGYKNQKLFILFLSYTVIFSITYVLHAGMVVFKYLYNTIISSSTPSVSGQEESEPMLLLVLVGVVSVYALYSCIEFLSDQIDNLDTNTTLIETYKGTRGRHVSSLTDTFTEIAGNDRLMWLIPVNSYMPPTMTESIYEGCDMFDTHPLQYDTIVNDTAHLSEDGDDDDASSPVLRKRHN